MATVNIYAEDTAGRETFVQVVYPIFLGKSVLGENESCRAARAHHALREFDLLNQSAVKVTMVALSKTLALGAGCYVRKKY